MLMLMLLLRMLLLLRIVGVVASNRRHAAAVQVLTRSLVLRLCRKGTAAGHRTRYLVRPCVFMYVCVSVCVSARVCVWIVDVHLVCPLCVCLLCICL